MKPQEVFAMESLAQWTKPIEPENGGSGSGGPYPDAKGMPKTSRAVGKKSSDETRASQRLGVVSRTDDACVGS